MQPRWSRLDSRSRRWLAAAIATTLFVALLCAAGVAWAASSNGDPSRASATSGAHHDNGTVKLHDGAAEPNPVSRDELHVCRFHVQALFFDAGQTLTFEVTAWRPAGRGATVLTGMVTADADGAGRAPAAGAYSLPDGHYKLIVHTGAGGDKQKVFWVRCAATTTTASATSAPATTAAPGTTAAMPSTSAATPTTMAAASSSQAPTSTSAEAASATLTSTPSTQAGGGLSFTGTPAIPLLVAALVLLAVGASTLFGFRRRASQR